MKNVKFGQIDAGITLALEASVGAAGDVVPVGTDGLAALLITDIATASGPNAAGLAKDYATARLLPAQLVVELAVTGSEGDPVFATINGNDVEYGTSPAGVHIGHIVAPQGHTPGSGKAFVYLGTAGQVAVTGS